MPRLSDMGYEGAHGLSGIYRDTTRHEFYAPCSLVSPNVFSFKGIGSNPPLSFDSFQFQPKPEMYSVPMSSIFNFHLKMEDENQQNHRLHYQLPSNNGIFLKKEVALNEPSQLMPPAAHGSQAIAIVTPAPVGPSVTHAPITVYQEDNFVLEHHIKMSRENPKPYTCNYCAKAYKQLTGIKNHVKTHLANNEAILSCSVCGKTSTCTSTIEKPPFVCKNCRDVKQQIQQQQQHNHQQQTQHGHSQLIQHVQTEAIVVGYHQVKPRVSNPMDDEEEGCPESEKQYLCQYCHKRFQHPSTLNMHLKKHSDAKPFVCSYCNKNFKRNSSLKIHERTHTGEKTHECSYCGKLFAYEVFLKVHLRKHTGEKPFSCAVCEKTFTQAGNLKSHVKRKHVGVDQIIRS